MSRETKSNIRFTIICIIVVGALVAIMCAITPDVKTYSEYVPEGYAIHYYRYEVQEGDTLEGITRDSLIKNYYNAAFIPLEVQMVEIMRMNNVGDRDYIVEGWILNIPYIVEDGYTY